MEKINDPKNGCSHISAYHYSSSDGAEFDKCKKCGEKYNTKGLDGWWLDIPNQSMAEENI